MQESQVQFLSQEDTLEKEMATHFGGLQSMGSQKESDMTRWLNNKNKKSLIMSKFHINELLTCSQRLAKICYVV